MSDKKISRQTEMVSLLIRNELALGGLYSFYSQKFPKLKGFWDKLVIDEKNHAAWIQNLYERVGEGSVFLNEDRFNLAALSTFNKKVLKEIDRVKNEEMTSIEALAMAVDMETALIESKFFECFEHDSVEVKQVLNKLMEETRKHTRYVEAKLKEEKRGREV